MKKRPNFLWVSFEDTNPFYGCYGDKIARTPTLDELAKNGILYKNCFATSGVCAPARSSVITGMYPTSIGTQFMRTSHVTDKASDLPTPYSAVVPHYVKCFSEFLRREGYYCTNNVKTDYQFDHPFTAWDDCSKTAHWRNRDNKDQPFFAVFNPTRTHESGMWESNPVELTFDPKEINVPPIYPDTLKVRQCLARMYSQIEISDSEFGERIKELKEDGEFENTYIMHWSDHGPLPRGKRWPYDMGIHVPLIISGPNLAKGKIIEELVSTIDLGPTVLSLANIKVPNYMQGQAILGTQSKGHHEYIYASRDRHDESYDYVRAVRSARYKYIRHYHPEYPYLLNNAYRDKHPIMQEQWRLYMEGERDKDYLLMFKEREAEELYDILDDPFERNNLANDSAYKEELEKLSTKLDQWMIDIKDMGDITETKMVESWYPNGVQPTTSRPTVSVRDVTGELENQQNTFQAKGLARLHFQSCTQGASLGYTFNDEESKTWNLYSRPLELKKGKYNFQVKAIRIGFKESDVIEFKLVVE